jgi:hypothetical protein
MLYLFCQASRLRTSRYIILQCRLALLVGCTKKAFDHNDKTTCLGDHEVRNQKVTS